MHGMPVAALGARWAGSAVPCASMCLHAVVDATPTCAWVTSLDVQAACLPTPAAQHRRSMPALQPATPCR